MDVEYVYFFKAKPSLIFFQVKQLQVADGEREKISFLKSLQVQTMPLLKPPYLKWLFLNGFLLFGIFSV